MVIPHGCARFPELAVVGLFRSESTQARALQLVSSPASPGVSGCELPPSLCFLCGLFVEVTESVLFLKPGVEVSLLLVSLHLLKTAYRSA